MKKMTWPNVYRLRHNNNNKSFDIRDPPSNVIGDKVQSRDEAKGKIEAEVIISCRRSKINLYFNTN